MQSLQHYVNQNSKKSKKTTYSKAYKVFTLAGLFYIAIYRTFVFQQAYIRMRIFLRPAKNKTRTQYAYFSGIYKKICLRCDVTRLLSVVVILLAFETFNVGSDLTKLKTFCFYRNVVNFFCNHFCDPLFGRFYKVSKTRSKVLAYLINRRFS